jgi:hypothetical protein
MKKEIKSYCLMLKSGEMEERIIRGISIEGGKRLQVLLTGDPPLFIRVKGRLVARSEISQLVPVYL